MAEPLTEAQYYWLRNRIASDFNLATIGQQQSVALNPLYELGGPLFRSALNPAYGGGAKFDGVTDDYPALQAVLTAGGHAMMPSGTAIIGSRLLMASNMTLRGAGRRATVVKVANAANISNAQGVVHLQGGSMVTEFTLDGNQANQTANNPACFQMLGADGFTSLVRVRAINAKGPGIYAFQTSDMLIEDCEIESPVLTGIQVGFGGGAARIRLRGNRIEAAGAQGVLLGGNPGVTDVVIEGNVVHNSGDIGIACGSGNSYIVISGNRVDLASTAVNCIDVGSCTDLTITGNVTTGGRDGIDCAPPALRVACSGNVIVNPHFVGIDGGVEWTISGNYVRGAGDAGIVLDTGTNCTVTGNIVKNSSTVTAGKPGILLYGTNAGGCQNIIISGNRCFDDQGVKTQAYGLQIGGPNTSSGLTVMGNDFTGNLTAPINFANASTGIFRNNNGYNPVGVVVVAVPASTVAVAAAVYDRTFYVTAGTSTCTMAIQGGPSPVIPANGFAAIRVPAGLTVTPTYANAPTWVVEGE